MTTSKLEKELIEAIVIARIMTKERLAREPGHNLFHFADKQLDEIERLIKQPSNRVTRDTTHIKLGIMTVRALGQHEDDYSDALCLVNYLFDKLIHNNT